MSNRVLATAVDATDPELLAEFWCSALGYRITARWADTRGTGYVEASTGGEPILLFQPVTEAKAAKNRLHLDIAPRTASQDDEVRRLVGLGATVLSDDPDFPWVVLQDPEGNEFCVLPPRGAC